ncbi:hypothetical protein HID58_033418 [Brassica napus]|uniref:Uncharacterized protein n=1 Tax=Brassica napus TaxID=3708 RepID=A0ABQ8BZ61_BRANA|nr:hypothetical protein HID58_033418 [Brassica napus]
MGSSTESEFIDSMYRQERIGNATRHFLGAKSKFFFKQACRKRNLVSPPIAEFIKSIMSKSLPLRSGVQEFIDDAYTEKIPVAIVTAYCKSGDKVTLSIVEMLGQERLPSLKVIGDKEVDRSRGSASEGSITSSVDIDTSSAERGYFLFFSTREKLNWKRLSLRVESCVLVAPSQSGVYAAKMIGMRSRYGVSEFDTSNKLIFRHNEQEIKKCFVLTVLKLEINNSQDIVLHQRQDNLRELHKRKMETAQHDALAAVAPGPFGRTIPVGFSAGCTRVFAEVSMKKRLFSCAYVSASCKYDK